MLCCAVLCCVNHARTNNDVASVWHLSQVSTCVRCLGYLQPAPACFAAALLTRRRAGQLASTAVPVSRLGSQQTPFSLSKRVERGGNTPSAVPLYCSGNCIYGVPVYLLRTEHETMCRCIGLSCRPPVPLPTGRQLLGLAGIALNP